MSKNKKTYNRNRNKKDDYKKEKEDVVNEAKDSANPRTSRKGWNDSRWYMPNEFIRKLHDFAMEGILGIPTNLSDASKYDESLPTVMEIEFFHTPGDTSRDILNFANSAASPINIAAKSMYTRLSAQNRKTTQYQPMDIALAAFAESELIAMAAIGARAYGLAMNFNARNRDLPRMLIEASGFDPDSILDHRADFCKKFNYLMQWANSLKFVDGIKDFVKSWELFASVYVDDPAELATYYVNSLYEIGVYTETPDPSDPTNIIRSVKYEPIGSTPGATFTATQYLLKLEKMLTNLATSSLMNYVYSDLINFMKNEGAREYVFGLLPENYFIMPVYDATYLNQIHNLEIRGECQLNDITQDPTDNTIHTNLVFLTPLKAYEVASYLDFPFTSEPSLDDKIDAVMFKSTGYSSVSGGSTYPNMYLPGYKMATTWIPRKIRIFGCGNLMVTLNRTHLKASDVSQAMISILSKFNHCFLLYIYDDTSLEFTKTIGDLSTFTVMRYADLKEIMDQSVLGLETFDAENTFGKGVDTQKR